MGRIFETRKATMFARWDKMSKAFTRIGKEIAIAVKSGGPSPENNPALRRAVHPGSKPQEAINKVSAETQVAWLGGSPFGPWVKAVHD